MTGKRTILVVLLLTMLVAMEARAGFGAESCLQDEQRLRSEEAEACSGLSYILNPSACFKTRKELAPYDRGLCKGAVKQATSNSKPVEPVREATTTPVSPAPAQPAKPTPITLSASPAKVSYVEVEVPGQPGMSRDSTMKYEAPTGELEQLRCEVAALRAELELLKAEVARLREVK